MDSGVGPPKKKAKLNSSSAGGGGTNAGSNPTHRLPHSSAKDNSSLPNSGSVSGNVVGTTTSEGGGIDGSNYTIVIPKIRMAKKVPPIEQNGPSQVAVEEVTIGDTELDSEKPYNIVPQVPVPRCQNELPAPPGAKLQATEDILGWDSQHAYIQRWVRMTKEERNENVKFRVVRNDSKKENLLLLLGLKNVFVKQLPNMPRPYVSRLVFDRKHESLALLKKTGGEYEVMGGCCYRPFREQKFGEIAFLAISHTEQVRGYGTRLMAQTKEQAKRIGLTHLLTCADNQAVPYFKKQGFSNRITLPKEIWQGYIKDYDGVTLMECILHHNVDYLNIPMLLKAQKLALVEKLREISYSHVVYPGIDAKIRRGMTFDEIPGFKQLGVRHKSSSASTTTTNNNNNSATAVTSTSSAGAAGTAAFGFANRDKTVQEQLQKHLQSVLNEIKLHDSAWPFLEPVDEKATGAYDYYEVIKNPMDLSTMQKQLDEGNFYVTKEIFIADLKRMVENCKTYNGKSQFTDMALQLEKVFMNKI